MTITVEGTLPLENRIELMTSAFIGIIKKWPLVNVVSWDVIHGRAEFVVDGAPSGIGQANVRISSEPL